MYNVTMNIIMLVTAVYGVSYALVYLDGPFDIFERFRYLTLIKNFGVFGCLMCTSFWVSVLLGYQQGIVTILSIWGACILIDNIIERL